VQFLSILSQSDMIKDAWQFNNKQTHFSPAVASRFASSLTPLCNPWILAPGEEVTFTISPFSEIQEVVTYRPLPLDLSKYSIETPEVI